LCVRGWARALGYESPRPCMVPAMSCRCLRKLSRRVRDQRRGPRTCRSGGAWGEGSPRPAPRAATPWRTKSYPLDQTAVSGEGRSRPKPKSLPRRSAPRPLRGCRGVSEAREPASQGRQARVQGRGTRKQDTKEAPHEAMSIRGHRRQRSTPGGFAWRTAEASPSPSTSPTPRPVMSNWSSA
jgi:hypothetical protein